MIFSNILSRLIFAFVGPKRCTFSNSSSVKYGRNHAVMHIKNKLKIINKINDVPFVMWNTIQLN